MLKSESIFCLYRASDKVVFVGQPLEFVRFNCLTFQYSEGGFDGEKRKFVEWRKEFQENIVQRQLNEWIIRAIEENCIERPPEEKPPDWKKRRKEKKRKKWEKIEKNKLNIKKGPEKALPRIKTTYNKRIWLI